MTTTFVTALYKLDERQCDYLKLFKPLIETGIQIHLFIQPALYNTYMSEIGQKDNIHITNLEFEELFIYKKIYDNQFICRLPEYRTVEKDTEKFMILMNSKIEFVKRAIDKNVFNSTQFAWIDFGISKIVKHPSTLQKLNYLPTINKLYIPAIWPKHTVDFSRVCWRFCGGFFIGDIQSLLSFYTLYETHFMNTLKSNNYILSWEVNFWAHFEFLGLFQPETYLADHNDSMLLLPF